MNSDDMEVPFYTVYTIHAMYTLIGQNSCMKCVSCIKQMLYAANQVLCSHYWGTNRSPLVGDKQVALIGDNHAVLIGGQTGHP